MATSTKKNKKTPTKKTSVKETENKPKKVSKTWLAFLEAAKDPGEILDMRAVLK